MKKKTFASLKRKLDAIFSQYIRRRHATSQGLAVCVSCGSVKPWKEQQCGHYVSRVYLATRWHERNCAVQCSSCNVLRRGNYVEYTAYMLRKYGQGVIDELRALKNRPVKFSSYELEEKIAYYKGKLDELDKPSELHSSPGQGQEAPSNRDEGKTRNGEREEVSLDEVGNH